MQAQDTPGPLGAAAAAAATPAAIASSSPWGDTVIVTPGPASQATAAGAAAATAAAQQGGGSGWESGTVVVKTPAVGDSGTVRVLGAARGLNLSQEDEESDFMAALASARSAAAAGAGAAQATPRQQQQPQQGSDGYGTVVVGGTTMAVEARGQGLSGVAAGLGPMPADAEEDNSYLAALKSAAADRERGQRGGGIFGGLGGGLGAAPSGPPPPLAPPGAAASAGGGGVNSSSSAANAAALSAAAAAAAAMPGNPVFMERLCERLAAWYESGLLVQLPFLSAASAAAPLALLGPLHAPCSAPLTGSRPGGVQGLDPEAYALLQDLAEGGLEALLQRPGADEDFAAAAGTGVNGQRASHSMNGSQPHRQQRQGQQGLGGSNSGSGSGLRPLGMGTRGGSLRRDVRSKDQAGNKQQQWQKQQEQQQQRGKLPPHVVSKALQNPSVQNLARCLAYHRACLLELPLEQAAAAELVQLITDMGSALQTILAL